jgi:UDP-galactopyranose mutase
MARIVIIGAGLTGLSVAYHLEQHNFFDYIIFEKESIPGGLCRSVRADGFTFDYTGHFFHSPSASMIDFLQAIMPSPLIAHRRRSFVYSQETYSPYPYQTNLHGLPAQTIIDCIKGYVERSPRNSTSNFEDWVLTYFGTGFAHHFFFPYQEKIFDFPVSKLRTGWQQAVPQTSLEDILIGHYTLETLTLKGIMLNFGTPKKVALIILYNLFIVH